MTVSTLARLLGCAASTAFISYLLVALYRFFASVHRADRLSRRPRRDNTPRSGLLRPLIIVVVAFVVSRALMLGGGMLSAWEDGFLARYLWEFPGNWTRWDANHYIGLIENWYVDAGDPRLHIVFFPLYPAICRLIYLATGLDARIIAYFVSNAAFIGCGLLMYLLARRSYGERAGCRAAMLLMFSPLTLFCSVPYTESVFLLMTLAAVYCARRRKFPLAVIFGALSANARLAGMATAIPIFWEILRASRDAGFRKYAVSVIKVLPVALGLGAYIYLNYAVTGDAFRFLEYQQNHWNQSIGSLCNTVGYTFRNALNFGDAMYRRWLWTPQLFMIFASLGVLMAAFRRARPGDMAYSAAYYYVSLAPTWLLSGARYLSAMYSLYIALAAITENKWVFRALLIILALLCAVAGAGYSAKGYVL